MSLTVAGVVVALILAGLALCLAYLVFVQYGRLLTRIEATEERLRRAETRQTVTAEPEKFVDPLPEERQIRAGVRAPSFRLPLLRGGDLVLEEYRGRRVLLVIADPACLPCRDLLPQLEKLARGRSGDPAVLLVSRGDREANAAMAAELDLTMPIALQRGWEIAREYGMVAAPVGYLIDPYGTLEKPRAIGVEAILALVAEEPEQRIREKEEVFSHA